jgi:hypothetical protein
MNDLDEIRRLLPVQPPPSDRLVADVRARLTGTPRSAPRRSRMLVPLAAAAAVVVAAAVISLPGNDGPPAASAKNILLTAAEQLGTEAAETGRFWRTRVVTDFDESTNLPRGITETWLSGDGREADWMGTRNLDTNPPDKGSVFELPKESQILPGVTAKVGDLPADPAALRTFLLEHRQEPSTDPRVVDEYLFASSVMLLAEVPATPQTRAAALRLIAELGAVEDLGPVKDPLGRNGNGVALSQKKGELALTVELVLDPAGTLLSVRYVTDQPVKNYYVAVLAAGWTDEKPSVPSPEVP